MKKFVFILFVFLNTMGLMAQTKRSAHYAGVHAGTTTAYGLSYRYWPHKLGIEITALPTFYRASPVNKNIINSKISSGISVLYKIKEAEVVDLYTYLGGFSLFEKSHYAEHIPPYYVTNYIKKESLNINLGVGLGMRVRILEAFDVNLQLGYGLYKITHPNDFYTLATGEVGLYYNF